MSFIGTRFDAAEQTMEPGELAENTAIAAKIGLAAKLSPLAANPARLLVGRASPITFILRDLRLSLALLI